METVEENALPPVTPPVENQPFLKMPRKNLLKVITIIILAVVVGGGGLYFFLNKNEDTKQNGNKTVSSATPAVTSSLSQSNDSNTIDKLNAEALIKIPFVRDGNIYLYEDGKEKIIAKPARQEVCTNLVNPFLSPNGKFIAYIEQLGGEPGYGGCPEGVLRIVDVNSGKNSLTNYKISYFKWNSSNQIVLNIQEKRGQSPQTYTDKEIFYDPITTKEIVFNTVIDQDKATYEDIIRTAEYPYSVNKLILYKNKKYYIVDKSTNREEFLFDNTDRMSFTGWSPDGVFAIFQVNKPSTDSSWISINTTQSNPKPVSVSVKNLAGGAGGDIPAGPKWYFNKAFLLDCQQELLFVDGVTSPMELTHTGGGGCHNSEGFVATSPNDQYAFVKFGDRFELHTLNGEKTVIKETSPLEKSRLTPKNLIWINNDYMVIFERATNADYGTGKKPRVFLFDRKANEIKPLIENAYLKS